VLYDNLPFESAVFNSYVVRDKVLLNQLVHVRLDEIQANIDR